LELQHNLKYIWIKKGMMKTTISIRHKDENAYTVLDGNVIELKITFEQLSIQQDLFRQSCQKLIDKAKTEFIFPKQTNHIPNSIKRVLR